MSIFRVTSSVIRSGVPCRSFVDMMLLKEEWSVSGWLVFASITTSPTEAMLNTDMLVLGSTCPY